MIRPGFTAPLLASLGMGARGGDLSARRFRPHRRLLAAVTTALLACLVLLPACSSSRANPVLVENRHAGTTDWQIGRPGYRAADPAQRQIEGYASETSVNKGARIAFHVSVDHAQSYTADVYRMGWYGGRGGRLMVKMGTMPGENRPACDPERVTGLVACPWPASFTLDVPSSWTSGIYLVLLTNADRYQRYVVFVVRDDARSAALLYQQSVTTYQAYNNYPGGTTGKSLYEFNSSPATVPATATPRAAMVSFDRPYADGEGSGQFAGSSGSWERYFVGWLERSGYDVTYSTDLDTATNGARLLDVKGFLSVGHDEYWSKSMVDAVTRARDAGVSLGFFGSNTAYWQVRFQASSAGVPNRVMVCYKDAAADPVKGPTSTVNWRSPPVNRPEQALVGVQYTAHLKDEGNGALYVVKNSGNWVWKGTGFDDGSTVAGIVGYETDRSMPGFPLPPSSSYTLLSESPVVDESGAREVANTSVYQAPSGAWVFATGTNHWSYGLGKPGVSDRRVQRATANVLDRFLTTPPVHAPAPAAPTGLTAVALSSSVVVLTWASGASQDEHYRIERARTGEPAWEVLTTALPAATTSYQDSTAAASTRYSYRVRAEGRFGASDWSSSADATTRSEPLFGERFSGADGSPWSPTSWDTSAGDGTLDLSGGAGRLTVQGSPATAAEARANMKPAADTDVLTTVRFDATAPRGFLYVFTRASGDWVRGYPRTSYFLRLLNDDTNLQLWSSRAGVTTLLASGTGGGVVGNQAQWVRFRVEGSHLSAKVWPAGSPQPQGWQVTATDRSVRGGGVLQLKWATSEATAKDLRVFVDDVEVRPS